MTNSIGRSYVLALLFLFVGLCLGHTSLTISTEAVTFAPQETRSLTPQEKRGKAFYRRGESSSGHEITASLAELDVTASTVTCAGCHGLRGEGKTEGGVVAGNVRWSFLTMPDGHVDGDRKHPAFSESSFIRTMTVGIDPAGNRVSVAMPIYRLSESDMADLIAYLKQIQTDLDRGLTDSKIIVGTIVPGQGALVELGQAMREILQAYFDRVNNDGGIHGRNIELRVAAYSGDPSSIIEQARHLVDKENVFALVSGVTAGADEGVASLSNEVELPVIGPSTLVPHKGDNRYIFYLLPGVQDQAGALVNFAAKRADPTSNRLAILSPDVGLNRIVSATIEARAKRLGLAVTTHTYAVNGFDPTELAGLLAKQRIENVFFLGTAAQLSELVKQGDVVSWNPFIYSLGLLAGGIGKGLPPKMNDRIYLAFPTMPGDVSRAGKSTYEALLAANKLGEKHTAARLSALAAAITLVEALKLTGRDLTPYRLLDTLEGLRDFDTGLTPKITFGPHRRIGALGAYIVKFNPETGMFSAAEWVASD